MNDDSYAVAALLQYLARRHGRPQPTAIGPENDVPPIGELVGLHVSFDVDEVYPDTAIKVWRDGDDRLHVEMQWPHQEGDGA